MMWTCTIRSLRMFIFKDFSDVHDFCQFCPQRLRYRLRGLDGSVQSLLKQRQSESETQPT